MRLLVAWSLRNMKWEEREIHSLWSEAVLMGMFQLSLRNTFA